MAIHSKEGPIALWTGAVLLLLAFGLCSCAKSPQRPDYALVLHGGAGTILKKNMDAATETAYRDKLTEALKTGEGILKNGGDSLDAVQAVIEVLEDSPLFNAGRGAVFTAEGKNEMDASIMDGRTLNAGAVAGVTTIKHPIAAARAVMTQSKHVLLSGKGAESFAAEHGLGMEPPEYFWTQRRWDALQKMKAKSDSESPKEAKEHGTVGCVALDKKGNIAAGTSTGGLTGKLWGRIGDSPIIGAGTYASNESCGVSCTGQGEYFIRNVVAYDLAARMKYRGMSLKDAAESIIDKELVEQHAEGGLVALDKDGNIAMVFNTPGMYRGFVKSSGELVVKFYGDEGEGAQQ
ncbi:MAG TPA: isoaspartyl peptidase/L-asparaginase [Candidatus Krumholzibacteria bacterium]|nr:isoaspartyl peptidase/L-asparaginase [Candidatus Krumholzibacteria bacterium]